MADLSGNKVSTTPSDPSSAGDNRSLDFRKFMDFIVTREFPVSGNRFSPEIETIVVCDNYEVPFDLYIRVGKAQEDILPALMKHANYTTADICGDELWYSLSSSERRFAYLCLKHIMGISGQLQFPWQEEGEPRYFQLS